MRIGIEATAYYKNIAGSGVYARNIINIWKKKEGNKNTIFLFSSKRPSEIDLGKKKNIFARLINGIKDILWMQIVLPIKLKKNNVDILFCPTFLGPIFSHCPTIVTILDMSFIRYPQTLDRLFLFYVKILLPLIKKRANVILTISEFSKMEIIKLLKVPKEKIKVIYGGCDEKFNVISDEVGINKVKNKYKLSQKFILNVGTLEPRKNITSLIAAFNELKKKQLIDHKLVLCGPKGWHYKDIFKKIKELKLENEIIFLGFIPEEDLPFLYNVAQVFVYPSLYEGFGLPVLEAMSCGCPVITSNVSSLPEIVGNSAILVDSLNTEELEQAILKVIKNKDLRKDLIKKGIERSKMFSWEKAAEDAFAILKRIFKNNSI